MQFYKIIKFHVLIVICEFCRDVKVSRPRLKVSRPVLVSRPLYDGLGLEGSDLGLGLDLEACGLGFGFGLKGSALETQSQEGLKSDRHLF